MRISYSKNSQKELREIKNYISKFNPENAKRFIKKLKNNIENIPNFPYKYRKSIYFDDENIRDMIIDGYTIIYEIKNDKIMVLNIFNKNKGAK
jgi:addiction module RelE/StbE family toxin